MKGDKVISSEFAVCQKGSIGLLEIVEIHERFNIMNNSTRFVGSERRK